MLTIDELQQIKQIVKEEVTHGLRQTDQKLEQVNKGLQQARQEIKQTREELKENIQQVDQKVDKVYAAAYDGFERVIIAMEENDLNQGKRIEALEKHVGLRN